MKKSITALAVGSAALVAVPVVAGAQETDEPTTTDSTITDDAGRQSHGRGGHHGHFGSGSLDSLTDVLGLTDDELRTALQEGKSLADIAGEQSVDVDTVVDALVADAEARVAEAVAAERLTQTEADEKLAEIEARITDRVNSILEMPEGRSGGMRGFGGFADLAELFGLDRTELLAAVQDGSTLGEVAEANGVSIDELRSAMLAEVEEHLAEGVADERLTQEQADERLAAAEEGIDDVINGEMPTRPEGFGRDHSGPQGFQQGRSERGGIGSSDTTSPAGEEVSLST